MRTVVSARLVLMMLAIVAVAQKDKPWTEWDQKGR